MLTAKAFFEGEQHDAFIRLARQDNEIYLDLCDPERHIIEVTPEGWRQVEDAPVRFHCPPGMAALPLPQTGGSVEDLRPFVNVRDEESFILAVAWLVGALNPDGPFPIALIQGRQVAVWVAPPLRGGLKRVWRIEERPYLCSTWEGWQSGSMHRS